LRYLLNRKELLLLAINLDDIKLSWSPIIYENTRHRSNEREITLGIYAKKIHGL